MLEDMRRLIFQKRVTDFERNQPFHPAKFDLTLNHGGGEKLTAFDVLGHFVEAPKPHLLF